MLIPLSVDKAWHGYCHGAGETCSKLKRAAGVVAESVAQRKQTSELGTQAQLQDLLSRSCGR